MGTTAGLRAIPALGFKGDARQGIEYEKVIAAHGSPIPFLRKESRDELAAATGDRKLPTGKLQDGTVLKNSRAILKWVASQPSIGAQS